ncbi:hypothetical protein KSS87_001392 [Heliosperma pusillum]|nr:hypothetical protein KSS87_001392 [Heliosperma pusillum]
MGDLLGDLLGRPRVAPLFEKFSVFSPLMHQIPSELRI